MTRLDLFNHLLEQCPLVAIIRGVRPQEVEEIGQAIFDAGIRIIEVPLNSPDPLDSIGRLSKRFSDRALIGAGTVLDVAQAAEVKQAGGQLIVSPNTDAAVIHASVSAGMISAPGYFTPSEAFTAIQAGAHALKLFPAEGCSPALLKAHKAVVPAEVPVLVVGGVRPDNMTQWLAAGAAGFGLGSGLYKPGRSPGETAELARAYVDGVKRR